jgi:hypothetical protein
MVESPFKILNEISEHKEISNISNYNSFLGRRFFSNFVETIFYANEANKFNIASEMEIDFFKNSIKPKKRFSKWYKSEKSKNIELIISYYDCSYNKAKEIQKIITKEQIKIIIEYNKEKGE